MKGNDHGPCTQPADQGAFLGSGETCGRARIHSRVVLRHAAAECRGIRGHGRGGHEDLQDQALRRRLDPIESNRSGCRERSRFAERLGAGPDRLWCVDRLHRPSDPGARSCHARTAREVRGGRRKAAPGQDRRVGRGRRSAQDPVPQSRARADQHQGSYPHVPFGLRPQGPTAHGQAGRRVDRKRELS